MPIQIEEITSEVTAVGGALPLSQEQIERLVQIVLKRLDGKQRESEKHREATALRRGAAPPSRVGHEGGR